MLADASPSSLALGRRRRQLAVVRGGRGPLLLLCGSTTTAVISALRLLARGVASSATSFAYTARSTKDSETRVLRIHGPVFSVDHQSGPMTSLALDPWRKHRRTRSSASVSATSPPLSQDGSGKSSGKSSSSSASTASWAQLVGSTLLKAFGVVLGVIGLLYLTRGFESLMERTGEMLSGRSALGAGALGIAVGVLHTFAGPDHLAGLAPLILGQRRSPLAAFGLGALWGSGHATGQLIIGLGCLLVRAGLIHMAWAPAVGKFSGLLVGASLVAIGLLGFYETRKYEESKDTEEGAPAESGRFGWATYATGVVHGLSLDAIIFITPALALPRLPATFHVAGVVGGTLLSMGLYTSLLSALCRGNPRLSLISTGASSIAILLGVLIALASFGISISLLGLD
mmetsp:Transcript_30924/g.78316  ORF Transcript_30924/g.78316 Transcript_30924/m.78316 type:complete len:400 (+) Transcript_30924:162-1361(+)